MKDKPDIFKFFGKMNRGEYSFVDTMSDDDIKSMAPYVVLCWCHGAQTNTAEHVILTDTYCNNAVFRLYKHPRLLLKLFVHANSGLGDNTRYKFVKSVTKEETNLLKLIARHYDCGLREAKDIKRLLSEKDVEIIKDMYAEK